MAVWMRASASTLALVTMAGLLAACSSTSTRNLNVVGQAPAAQAQPIQSSSVAQNQLPPLGGVQGQPAPGLSGQPVLGGVPAQAPAATGLSGQPVLGGTATSPQPGYGMTPTLPSSTTTSVAANTGASTVSLAPMGTGAAAGPAGVWNVVSGPTTCRLNLPLTAREGTSRYRASAPGCTLPGLTGVGSWQQVGSQVQLFDESNNMVAALAQSGTGYTGTLSGGQAISMSR